MGLLRRAPGPAKPLVSARILFSIKGPHGGYRLARKAEEISLLDVLEAVDGPIRGQAPLIEESNGPLNTKLEAVCKQGYAVAATACPTRQAAPRRRPPH